MPQTVDAKPPLVTFALFAYNQEGYVREAIAGAFAQTYEPLEIILSDDCSSDRTFEIMREMAAAYRGPHRIKLRRNAQNLGLAGHINAIVSEASGEMIAWAAGDDISIPERVSLLSAPLADPGVVASHSGVIEIDTDGKILGEREMPPGISDMTIDKLIENELVIVSQAHLFRRMVFEKFGPLDNSVTNEGVPMTFRELCLGRIAFVDKSTVYYRIGSGVSTYNGNDIDRIMRTEPIKVISWRYSGFAQACNDAKLVDSIDDNQRNRLLMKRDYYNLMLQINRKTLDFYSLFRLVMSRMLTMQSIKAFIRRNSPKILGSIYFSIFARRRIPS